MKLVTFVAENAEAALSQIHAELGPEAVVVSVRKLPANGISRLWQRTGGVEVVAGVAEKPKRKAHTVPPDEDAYVPFAEKIEASPPAPQTRRWQSIAWLETMGLLPAFADELEKKICARHGSTAPQMPIEEWSIVRDSLASRWRPTWPATDVKGQPHIFLGPAGSGKTTVLCKWMTTAILSEEQSVRVWRLDGETANTSEFLSLHCELMNVPVERFWNGQAEPADLFFVDLPGVETHNAKAMAALRDQIRALPQPHVHLVLNAACDTSVLFDQFHAFAVFAPKDVIFTHLDEERRRVKLWNFVLGTNCSISFLSGGQKIPGDFSRAETGLLFPSENRL